MKRVEQPEPVDSELIALLAGRDGQRTTVELRAGRQLFVFNIAWGYDMGDEYARVTTNVSPSIQGERIDFFITNEVDDVKDEAGRVLRPREVGAVPRHVAGPSSGHRIFHQDAPHRSRQWRRATRIDGSGA